MTNYLFCDPFGYVPVEDRIPSPRPLDISNNAEEMAARVEAFAPFSFEDIGESLHLMPTLCQRELRSPSERFMPAAQRIFHIYEAPPVPALDQFPETVSSSTLASASAEELSELAERALPEKKSTPIKRRRTHQSVGPYASGRWNLAETKKLIEIMQRWKIGEEITWKQIASYVGTRSDISCYQHWYRVLNCTKPRNHRLVNALPEEYRNLI